MQSIQVAAVSMNGGLRQPDVLLDSIADWYGKAKSQVSELVLFPELVVHGHCTPHTWDLAKPVPDGPSVKRIAEFARHHSLFLSVGLSEKKGNLVYNTQVLVGPSGYIGKQREIHLSRDEVLFYNDRTEMPVFDIVKCKVGTVNGYMLR